MRIWMRLFWGLGIFALGVGTIYWILTDEWAGAILLWFVGLMPLIVAVWATRRGVGAPGRPEDEPGADPGAEAGTSMGSFPTATGWPAFLVLGLIACGASLVYGLILLPAGLALVGWAAFGLMRDSRG